MNEPVRILSIDGGGIRGIVPGVILECMERDFNIKVSEYFDMITGTSTGGILACAYLVPDENNPDQAKFTAREVVDLYFDRGGEIFDIPFFHRLRTGKGILDEKYPEKGLEKALDDYFGDCLLSELLKPTIITSYDVENRKGHFFRQHMAHEAACNFKVKDICRATSAAPTYFECAKIAALSGDEYALIDGGVFVNNPALCAYSEVRNFSKLTAKHMHILSLGTGHDMESYPYHKVKNYGKAQWIMPALDIMMSGAADVTHFHLQQIFDTITEPKQYLRINKRLDEHINSAMDCATDENMDALGDFALKLYKENKSKIAEWLEIVKKKTDADLDPYIA